jgi:hypothetical protein
MSLKNFYPELHTYRFYNPEYAFRDRDCVSEHTRFYRAVMGSRTLTEWGWDDGF